MAMYMRFIWENGEQKDYLFYKDGGIWSKEKMRGIRREETFDEPSLFKIIVDNIETMVEFVDSYKNDESFKREVDSYIAFCCCLVKTPEPKFTKDQWIKIFSRNLDLGVDE